ncbi:MAG: N-acetylmuramoyl-L-alanine amidase [Clostridia bacterium]|nr:N-acetylmuramoyl-L-alanine amidase [Clostridia bacterium]
MQGNYNRQAVYSTRRKRRRRREILRRIKICLLTFVVTAAVVCATVFIFGLIKGQQYDEGFIPSPYGSNVSERVEKAEELEIPDWIDVQLIHPHNTARSEIRLTDIKNIVIHYVGNPDTTAQNNRDYFDKESTTVSSHFIVGLDGEIIQCLPLYEKSAASNHRNKDTISIEVCHPDETGKFSGETYRSVVKLAAWLCYEFDLDEKDVIRHYDITEKICPKYYVEHEDKWVELKNDIENEIALLKKK